jgi:hypothetical protein
MHPVDVYLMYCAIKAHFGEGDYNFNQFGGKSKVSKDSFWKRKDRLFFVRLSRKYKEYDYIKDYFVSNFVKSRNGWIGHFNEQIYEDWKKYMQSLTYNFEQELSSHVDDFEKLFEVPEGSHPLLLKEYFGKRVSLETLIILNELVQYVDDWDKRMWEDILWPDIKKLMTDYQKFLTIPKEKCKIVLLKLIAKEQ